MVEFYEYDNITYKLLKTVEDGAWLIDFEKPASPQYVSFEKLEDFTAAPVPEKRLDESDVSDKRLAVGQRRKKTIQLLTDTQICIDNALLRNRFAAGIAKEYGISTRTVLRYYYKYLAYGEKGLLPMNRVYNAKSETADQRKMTQALNRYYYSPKKMPLKMVYEKMLVDAYITENGSIDDAHPSFSAFRYFFDKKKSVTKYVISRQGISDYQKNYRPLTGKGDSGILEIGTYEMDATIADIYIVSSYNRKPIGRPYVYLAVDVASRLIAGVYVGLEGTSDSVLQCIANAAEDKVDFCAKYGIDITKDMWPSSGLPDMICTDRGNDFMSDRVKQLCEMFGMEITSLPAYRPDLKGYVEKAFDCIQRRYKPHLRGLGVIDGKVGERGVPSYIAQARLDLREFTKVVIECILYYNSAKVINSFIRPPEMSASNTRHIAADIWKWYENEGKDNRIVAEPEAIKLMLLPRAMGTITRAGLLYDNLLYTSNEIKEKMVNAKAYGVEKVKIAYNPVDNRCLYYLENGKYFPQMLTKASEVFASMPFKEVEIVMEEEREARKAEMKDETSKGARCSQNISDITSKAEKNGLATSNDTKRTVMESERDNERNTING